MAENVLNLKKKTDMIQKAESSRQDEPKQTYPNT